MNRYKLAVFDMDGTLLDTIEDLMIAVNVALEKHGMPVRTLDEIICFVGNGVRRLIEQAVTVDFNAIEDSMGCSLSEDEKAQVFNETVDSVLADFRAYYSVHCNDHTGPYPGIIKLLKDLKEAGVLLAVVSNKIDPAVKELAELHFKGLFDYVLGELPDVKRKPAPDMVEKVLNDLGIEKSEAVYIGDSDVDCKTAFNSGLDLIAVTWGFRSIDVLKENGAVNIVSNTDELYNLIILCSQI